MSETVDVNVIVSGAVHFGESHELVFRVDCLWLVAEFVRIRRMRQKPSNSSNCILQSNRFPLEGRHRQMMGAE